MQGLIKGQVVVAFEFFFDVVGIEHGILAGFFEIIAHAQDIAVGPQQDAEVAEKGVHLAHGQRVVLIQAVGVAILHHPGNGQEGFQFRGDAHRTGARTAAAVGGGERFVQVEVQHVHARVTEVDDAHDGVHVGAVAVDQAALAVNDVGHLADVFFKQPQGVGIGDHDAGGIFVHELCHRFGQQDTVFSGFDRHGLESAQGGAGRVGSVGGVGDEHLGAWFAPCFYGRRQRSTCRSIHPVTRPPAGG